MKVGDLIENLKTLDPNEDATPWLKAYAGNKEFKELTIARAGIALKAITPILGKPFLTQNADGGGKAIRWRIIMWKGAPAQFLLACNALQAQGINEFEITDSDVYFKIRLPRLAQFRDFSSNDPAVWEKNYQYRIAQAEAEQRALAEEQRIREEGWARDTAHWNSPEGIAERAAQTKKYEEHAFEQKLKTFEEVKEQLLTKQKAAIVTVKPSKRAISLGDDHGQSNVEEV